MLVACGPSPGAPVATCNGHAELCSRRLDQVTFAGTHNSMSNEDAGWRVPNQHHGLSRQLQDGVRSLMLDVHEWKGEAWLCHGYCELGAQPLSEGLAEVEDFLALRPDAFVLVIFEDYVSAELMAQALQDSGLADRALTWPVEGEVPTLGALLEDGRQILLTAQSGGPPPDWYQPAWELFFDTPYSFETAEDLAADNSCDLNRGAPENPLFLVNHWVGTPLPDAELSLEVNGATFLEARARRCAEAWGRTVSSLSVDFYDQGDLFLVVDRLNGL